MKDIAEILCFKTYGITCYQVNLINVRTGMYYNSSSRTSAKCMGRNECRTSDAIQGNQTGS